MFCLVRNWSTGGRNKCAYTAFGTVRTSPYLLKEQTAIVIFSQILSNVLAMCNCALHTAMHSTNKRKGN